MELIARSRHSQTARVMGEFNLRSVLVAGTSFLASGACLGTHGAYGVFFEVLQKHLADQGVGDASSLAALAGSIGMGLLLAASPISGVVTDHFGIRLTVVTGCFLAAAGLLLSSFRTFSVWGLCITYGVMFGTGTSLIYTPSMVVLGYFFHHNLGVVNGIVSAGSSIFTMLLPFCLKVIVTSSSPEWAFRFVAGLMSMSMVIAIWLLPANIHPKKPQQKYVINREIWRRKKYLIWTCAYCIAVLGYFVPYVHLGRLAQDYFPENNGIILIPCIGATSFFGRLLFGKISDIPRINRILLMQIALTFMGVSKILIPLVDQFWILVASVLSLGLFDGGMVALVGALAFDLCGESGAAQGLGFFLGFSCVSLSAGAPIAGFIYDYTKSYSIPFILSGVLPILSVLIMMAMHCVEDDAVQKAELNHQDIDVVQSTAEEKLMLQNTKFLQDSTEEN